MVTGVKYRHIICVVCALCISLIFSGKAFSQQETMYTQYMNNVLSINPAYAGSNNMLSVTALSRNQWVGISGAPETQTFSLHSPINGYHMGLGLSFLKDKIGVISQTGLHFDYSYTVDFDRYRYLAFGLKGGVNFYYASLSDLLTIDPNDPLFGSDEIRRFLPNVGVGVYYYTERFYAGLSAPKMIKNVINKNGYSSQQMNREELHLFFMSGYVFNINRILKFKPHVMVKYVRDAPVSIDFSGQFLIYERLWLGAMYRVGDAFGALLQVQITNQIRAGYSYDLSTSQLGAFNGGTHEISLSYDFNFGRGRVKSPRYF